MPFCTIKYNCVTIEKLENHEKKYHNSDYYNYVIMSLVKDTKHMQQEAKEFPWNQNHQHTTPL